MRSFGRPGPADAVLEFSLEKAQLKVPLFWSDGVGFARMLAFLVSILGAANNAAGCHSRKLIARIRMARAGDPTYAANRS
jgi:hypothetical protein